MPRLSEKTLEKRFQYDFCGGMLMSKQGLSGHIQFKHQRYFETLVQTEQPVKEIDMRSISSKQKIS